MEILRDIARSLEAGERERVAELTRTAVDEGLEGKAILDDGLIAGMAVVGERFRVHEIFLPEVLLAAKAMYAGMEVLEPLLKEGDAPSRGTVVLGTVKGDLHDIGKNLVAIMLEGAGFHVVDLGNDVAAERFVEAAVAEEAPVIGMSALLTTTMSSMAGVVELIRTRELTGRVKTIIGGAPVTEEYAREIGADAYGPDAATAVERVKELLSG